MLPILFKSQGLVIYSYPLLMGIGWGVGYQLFFELLPSELGRRRALILFWGIFLFSWVGAKVLFLLSVPHELSLNLLRASNFWLGGGFVFYGGLLGGLVFLGVLRGLRFPLNQNVLWAMLPALTIGHGLGRVGCFLAGCCFGKETDLFWGMHLHGATRHPTQLFEALVLLGLGFYLLRSRRKKMELVSTYLLVYGAFRFGIEYLRGDEIRGSWGTLTPSQWISLGLVLSGFGVLLRSSKELKTTH